MHGVVLLLWAVKGPRLSAPSSQPGPGAVASEGEEGEDGLGGLMRVVGKWAVNVLIGIDQLCNAVMEQGKGAVC